LLVWVDLFGFLGGVLQDNGLFWGLCCHFSLPAPNDLGEETDKLTHQLRRLTSSELWSS